MVNGFKKRKIASEKPLGEFLKSVRIGKELSICDSEAACKVKAKYLEDLEAGNWQSLPSFAYTRGFVLAYAKCLGLDRKEVKKKFEHEYGFINFQAGKNMSYQKALGEKKVLITPKVAVYTTFSMFLIAMFAYIAFQVAGFAGAPVLQLMNPSNNSIVESDSVNVRGLAENGDYLTINNEAVPVTTDGHFSTNLKLQRGLNVIKVQASNRAEKETSQIITIEYKPKTALIETGQTQ